MEGHPCWFRWSLILLGVYIKYWSGVLLTKVKTVVSQSSYALPCCTNTQVDVRTDPSRSVNPRRNVVNELTLTICIVPFFHWIAGIMRLSGCA